jgi:hypothetical protein
MSDKSDAPTTKNREGLQNNMIKNDDAFNSNSSFHFLIFRGTPAELLEELSRIALENKISTFSREWPKDQKWLVRRINIIKSNLQQDLGIAISIERDSKNASLIK